MKQKGISYCENRNAFSMFSQINRVLVHYGVHNAQWLRQLVHMEELWINAREGVLSGAMGSYSERIISRTSNSSSCGRSTSVPFLAVTFDFLKAGMLRASRKPCSVLVTGLSAPISIQAS